MAEKIGTELLDQCVDSIINTLKTLVVDLVGSSIKDTSIENINNTLRKKPLKLKQITFPLLLHNVQVKTKTETNPLSYDDNINHASPLQVDLQDRVNQNQPTDVSLFIPLLLQAKLYAWHQTFARLGSNHTCNTLLNLSIDSEYTCIKQIAIQNEFIFGIHVVMAVNDYNNLLSDLPNTEKCQMFPQVDLSYSAMQNFQSDPIKRPESSDFNSNLILYLLDLVQKHSSSYQDCFMAAYYSFALAEFINNNPNYYNDEEENPFAQLLKFGGDDMIISLVLKSTEYLVHSKVTIANYFDLETILSTAKKVTNNN